MKINDIKLNPDNPRSIDPDKLDKLKKSIKDFPKMMSLRPIVVDKDNVILGGNMRYRALVKLGYKEIPDEWIKVADNLTDEEKRRFSIEDNVGFGEWDYELLSEQYGKEELEEWGMDIDKWGEEENEQEQANNKLIDQFIIPPFSVLDARQGYWQERKNAWLIKIGNLTVTKEKVLGGSMLASINGGSSNFDPVLAEIVYKWFCPVDGKILDPFAGEQTKGCVAGFIGLGYTGIELRQDQVDVDTEASKDFKKVKYICGNSAKLDELVSDNSYDLIFTSPPYFDLEIYSEKKDDISNISSYSQFLDFYKEVLGKCVDKLTDNRFLVVKVGEIRDKKTGVYRNFVGDTIMICNQLGLKYYNEIILVNSVGTARLRAGLYMHNRKVVKVHQNILVFYKGDLGLIQDNFPKLKFNHLIDENES